LLGWNDFTLQVAFSSLRTFLASTNILNTTPTYSTTTTLSLQFPYHASAAVGGNPFRQDAVLVADSRHGVEHQDHHVTAADGLERPVHHEKLGPVLHFAPLTNSRGVHEAVTTCIQTQVLKTFELKFKNFTKTSTSALDNNL
jgi:hypothetical protein